LLASALLSGLGLGSMYGLLALGFYVTYSVSRTVNFSQGSSMMLGAVLAYTFVVRAGWPLVLAIAAALLLCALYGVVVERIAVRPFVKRRSEGWLMSTVAVGIIADNAVLFTFGKEPRGFSVPWTAASADVLGVHVSALQVAIPAVGLGAAAVLHAFSRRSRLGKAMRAVMQNPDAARLMGIDVSLAVAAAYAIASVFAGVAGVMIAPLFNVHSDMGTVFGLKAFAVAILGGITSAWGVVLAGLVFGAAESLITAFLGSSYTQILTFALVIVALAIRPDGLLGRAGVRKA